MTRRVVVAGGGTAGHVFPAVATARALGRLDPDVEPVFVGTADRLEARLVPEAGYRLHAVTVLPLPRRPSRELLRVPGALRRAVRRCEGILRDEGAVAAATFGGYVSLPVAWAARNAQVPLVVHEQNAVPGIANRIAARWADRVGVTFPGSEGRFGGRARATVVGNPVREEILALAHDPDAVRGAAREHFGLDPHRTTVLVFGGSQGARSLNTAIVDAARRWRDPSSLQVLHGCGRDRVDEARDGWDRVTAAGPVPHVAVVDFIDRMDLAYAAADVVVCRAGATSIAELTVLGRPAVLVPYPHATGDHQTHNARALERAGGAVVVPDDALDGARLAGVVQPWLDAAEVRRGVAAAARDFGRPDAAVTLASVILEVAGDAGRRGAAEEPSVDDPSPGGRS